MSRVCNAALALARHADRSGWSSRPAYLVGDETWSHGQIHDLAARATGVLHGHGIGKGDHVLLLLTVGGVLKKEYEYEEELYPALDGSATAINNRHAVKHAARGTGSVYITP